MNRPLRTSKLTEAEVLGIRDRVNSGLSDVKTEAERYGMARETIRKLMRGETYVSVGGVAEELPAARNHPAAPTEDEATASLNRILEMQKAKPIPSATEALVQARGLGDLIKPPEGEES